MHGGVTGKASDGLPMSIAGVATEGHPYKTGREMLICSGHPCVDLFLLAVFKLQFP